MKRSEDITLRLASAIHEEFEAQGFGFSGDPIIWPLHRSLAEGLDKLARGDRDSQDFFLAAEQGVAYLAADGRPSARLAYLLREFSSTQLLESSLV